MTVAVVDDSIAKDEEDGEHPFPGGALGLLLKARGLVSPLWTTAWYASPWASAQRRARFADAGIPAPPTSFAVLAGVATDELCRAVFTLLRRIPSPSELRRIEAETEVAIEQYEREGWLDDPHSYHQEPPPPAVLLEPTRVDVTRLECLRFASAWQPHPDEPGGDRWRGYRPNDVARAYVLRHPDGPRPWLVCVHATEMGRPEIDLRLFRAAYLHRHLGLNVAMPVLPLHGCRRPARGTGAEFPTADVLDNVHGLAQAASDVRSVIAWVRQQNPRGIGLFGVSLGGYVAALVAGLETPLDCVIAGLPVVDFPELFLRNSPTEVRRLRSYAALKETATAVHRVVSPLLLEPQTADGRRFLFAGLADRLVDPVQQAQALWKHWGHPQIHWFAGSHVGHLVDRGINRFIDDALHQSGLAAP
ncbi:MAG: alpha/beta hydrolase [Actinomycetota bacterium]|nr:alpha/beta hydrolase [Actinomycetota bacterium]